MTKTTLNLIFDPYSHSLSKDSTIELRYPLLQKTKESAGLYVSKLGAAGYA